MKLGRPRAHWIKYPTGQRLALAITTKREQGTVAIGQTRLRLASRVDASKELDLRLPSRRMTRYEARFHINSGGHDNLNRRLFFVLIARCRFTDAILRDAKKLTCAGIAKRRVAFVFTVVGMFALGIPIALSPMR